MNYPQIMPPVPFASKSGDSCPLQLLWERRPCRVTDLTQLTQRGETSRYSTFDVRPHRQVTVNIDTQVVNRLYRIDGAAVNHQWGSWYTVLDADVA